MYWGLIDGDTQQVHCHGSGACSEYLKEQGLLEETDITEITILKWILKM
jgi:hypothetical protein